MEITQEGITNILDDDEFRDLHAKNEKEASEANKLETLVDNLLKQLNMPYR